MFARSTGSINRNVTDVSCRFRRLDVSIEGKEVLTSDLLRRDLSYNVSRHLLLLFAGVKMFNGGVGGLIGASCFVLFVCVIGGEG